MGVPQRTRYAVLKACGRRAHCLLSRSTLAISWRMAPQDNRCAEDPDPEADSADTCERIGNVE
jgi:hypothetical protein